MTISRKLIQTQLKWLQATAQLAHLRSYSAIKAMTKENDIARRNELFDGEVKRQHEKIGRIEKIEVRYLGLPEDATLVMNKDVSTPYDCATHLSENHCRRSALALLDSHTPWDMHRPLQDSCTLQLLNFVIADPHIVNKAFWRTCSFMLGAALGECIKDEAGLLLHSFPGPNIKSGSFVHDIYLNIQGWKPTEAETKTISAEMIKLAAQDLDIERLVVKEDVAMDMFKDNHYKSQQLPSISAQNQGKVTLYRVGDHIDISRGPMVSSTRFLGKCTIGAVHEVAKEGEKGAFYRVQGVALPAGFPLNHVAYGIIEKRSTKMNPARLPNEPFDETTLGNGTERQLEIA